MARGADALLQDIVDELRFLAQATDGRDVEDSLTDPQLRRALERSLEIVGEATKALPAEVRVEHPDVPWSDMARTRDLLSHAYHRVEPAILWKTVVEDAVPLLPRVERILHGRG